MPKMIFINYCPDDQLSGCMILSYKAELAYRRIQDLIYTNDNLLFDDPISWDLATRGFTDDKEQIKEELIKKRKISIEDGQIKNKRCSEEIQAAKDRHDKSKKAAEARWGNANASSKHMLEPSQPLTTNHKPLTTNNKPNIYTQEFDIFWQKYVLSENDRRSTKYDSFKQWKKLKDEDKKSLGDKFLTYRNQKGEFYKALERFLSKKIYLEIVPEKQQSDQEMKDWKFKGDVEMRKKGIKPLSWSVGYIRELDAAIANDD
jgi:uncharacterized protein YdaU (DUF1376 family)|tara:strand:- start:4081 stop:4860 length:780 start_codon:yes stop_codon:yes gene_type:complete